MSETGGRNSLESNNMVTGLHICDALTNRLDNTSTFVSKNDGESTLGVLARQCVGIGMAHAGVVDLDADFVGLGHANLDVLDGEVLAGFPGDSGLCGVVSECWEIARETFAGFSLLPCK